MSDIRNAGTTGKARNRRIIKLAPITRAVRSALAVSALTLAIGVSGNAAAAPSGYRVSMAHALQTERPAIDFAPVFDLTAINTLLAPGGVHPLVASLIADTQPGDVQITNNTPIIDTAAGDITAISGYSTGGNVGIVNGALGAINVHSDNGNAIGIYGYALAGDVTIANVASVVADADNGLADGIFASGANVTVTNTGAVTATGYSWAAGIEAQATGVTSVTNTGSLYASASGGGGLAYGIYASGDDVTVVNDGSITARGYYATGINAQSTGDIAIHNYAGGSIDAGTTTGSALAWGINVESNGYGADVSIDNAADIHAAAVYGASGISATASGLGGTITINNSGDIVVVQNKAITSYGAYGILSSADADSTINNDGNVSVSSKGQAWGLMSMSFAGNADVTNTGNVSATSTLNSSANPGLGATGITVFSGNGTATVDNSGDVSATARRRAIGVDAQAYGDVTVNNSGSITATTAVASSARADGIKAISGAGNVAITNGGSIYATGATLAISVYAVAEAGDVTVTNDAGGDIGFYSYAGRGRGVFAYATEGDVTVNNAGTISGYAFAQTYGVLGNAPQGDVSVDNSGTINVASGNNKVMGVLARAPNGNASISNSGDIYAISGVNGYAGTAAYGVFATGANADVANSGTIEVHGNTVAVGVVAQSTYGASVTNTGGSIVAYANGTAIGITASASQGDVSIDNASLVGALSQQGNATGITASGYGNVGIVNTGNVYAMAFNNAAAIKALSSTGDVSLENDGNLSVYALNGSAIGLYAYSTAGNASVANTGDISAESVNGLADGIFVSGADVDVANSGRIGATGSTWAAGIEAQGTGATSVQNDGGITANATGAGAHAFGLYVTGQSVTIGNTGNIAAYGYYATGIEAQSFGDLAIDNSGDIVAGMTYGGTFYSALATGINAISSGEAAAVSVTSTGNITAMGYYGATGISAVSGGTGGTVNVDNSGDITVAQGNKYGYGAYGIATSADGDSVVNNSGAITVNSEGLASGITALSFAGNASVTNAGDITATSAAQGYFGASGITVFSANGSASVDNSGSVSAVSAGIYQAQARAVDAQALGDVTVNNSGSLYANGQKYAFGVYAVSGTGDVSVTNDAAGSIGFSSYLGRGWGVFGYATQGDVNITNAGAIQGYAYGQSSGAFGVAAQGSVTVDSSGTIDITSGNGAALGVFARADNGTASVTNSGDISVTSGGGYYAGTVAYGVLARGDYANVANSGNISATGYNVAIGAIASGYHGATVNSTGGSISASALGDAMGIFASSVYGGSVVNSSTDITAVGMYLSATGIRAESVLGDAQVNNSGAITALSQLGAATGISAYTIAGDALIENAGDVTAASVSGAGNAIGLYAYSEYGNATVHNSGALTAYSADGLADGIFGSGTVVEVVNSGAIDAVGYAWGAGIEAQGAAYVHVSNTGDINAQTMRFVQVADYNGNTVGGTNGGKAFGIYATGGTYGAMVANTGDITVGGGYATGIEVQSQGNLGITNSGDIVVGAGLSSYYNSGNQYTYYYGTQVAAGINASSNGENAIVSVSNSGAITADAIFGANGISAVSSGTGGKVGITNSGNISVSQGTKYGYGAYGISASGDSDASINNTGDVTVASEGAGTGLGAVSFAGSAVVVNHGDIAVTNTAQKYYSAIGASAFSANGDAAVGNYGSVSATSAYHAYGLDARAFGDATVVNGGSVYANGKYAFGVYASAGTGDLVVSNQQGGSIEFYSYAGKGWGAFGVATQGDVTMVNAGSIEGYAYGQSAGMFGVASQGDAGVGNSGIISVVSANDVAVGTFARADAGTATVTNSGDITAVSGHGSYAGNTAYGMFARGLYAQAANSGNITATGYYTATGIVARSDQGTTVTTASTSQVSATAYFVAIGIEGRSEYGDVAVTNAGGIAADGGYGAVGIQAYSAQGDSSASNAGHIVANSDLGMSIGLTSYAAMGDAMAGNSGTITATADHGAYGMSVQSGQGSVTANNSGSISATSPYVSIGIVAEAHGDVTVNNASTGHIEATNGDLAAGVHVLSASGDMTVNNAGIIHASGATLSVGVAFEGVYGTNTLNNLAGGKVSADGADGAAFAVVGGDGVEVINNSGTILGAINLYAGNDVFNNKAGGLWDVGSTTYTSFGDGNDLLTNAATGLITINGGAIAMDAGDDTITNAGTIRLTNGTITMGPAVIPVLPLAGEVNLFNNSGTLKVVGNSSIDTAGGTFSNTGLVDFTNGVTTDKLTLGGTLAGTGTMSIDVNLATLAADQLQVNGDVAGNAKQTVNVAFAGMPTTATTTVSFANVTGTSAAGNFVAGQFIGYNQNANFLTLGLGVNSAINATNTANDVFSISMQVNGLSDSGTLAASVASGAAGFLNTQVGTFRQRLGVNPYGDAGKVLSAFVRGYTEQGDMQLAHTAGNFGQGGNFNSNQTSWGHEVGINANLTGNFHAGLTFGNADSRQRLIDGGVGENRLDGSTFGAYATWYVPGGFYVDLSGRWMATDIRTMSAAGTMASRAHANAYSLEAGYEWQLGGMTLVPQAQYTRTTVNDVKAFQGGLLNFVSHGGTFSRGRIGVELNKTFQMGDVRWTPYGTLSAIHEFDGKSSYTVGSFVGTTSTQGTSAMAELGLGVQKGGFGFTIGANWTDGGAYKSFVGGQANVRFSW